MKAVPFETGAYKKAKALLADPKTPIDESDPEGFTPLLWAAREGFVEMTALLLQHHADPNHLDGWMGANSGHKAAFWGRTEVMKLLVSHHLDVNARGLYNNYTPLLDAVSGNHVETARVLLENGADPTLAGNDGKTPLEIATENGNAELIKLLMK